MNKEYNLVTILFTEKLKSGKKDFKYNTVPVEGSAFDYYMGIKEIAWDDKDSQRLTVCLINVMPITEYQYNKATISR